MRGPINPLKPIVIVWLHFECSAPYRPNLPFLISDIRPLWRSGLCSQTTESCGCNCLKFNCIFAATTAATSALKIALLFHCITRAVVQLILRTVITEVSSFSFVIVPYILDYEVLRFVTSNRMCVGRMTSPIGSSAQFCCSKFGFSSACVIGLFLSPRFCSGHFL